MHTGWISPEFIIKSSKIDHTIISGYASVFGIADSQNDIMNKGAFKNAENHKIKLLWQHDVTKPIGIITLLEEDEYGLKIEAEINNRITNGKEATELIKQRAVCGLSVGFTINESDYDKKGARVIKEANLMEVSIVTFPANNEARINHIRHHDNKDDSNKNNQIKELEALINKLEKY